jgi:hypothetical protein
VKNGGRLMHGCPREGRGPDDTVSYAKNDFPEGEGVRENPSSTIPGIGDGTLRNPEEMPPLCPGISERQHVYPSRCKYSKASAGLVV